LKICFVSFEYPPFVVGGAGGYAENLVKELSKLGHEVYVIAPIVGREQTSTAEDINVVRIPIVNLPSLRFLTFQLRLKKVLSDLERKVGGFDVLHANGISDFMISKPANYPRVVTVHHAIRDIQQRSPMKLSFRGFTGEENPISAYMERMSLSKAYKIISVSEATKKFLLKHYSLPADDVFTIHNGIYAEQYSFLREELMEARSLFGVSDDEKLIVCAPGRIGEPRKGIKYLLQALPEVFSVVKSKCIITGSGKKEAFGKYLRGLPQDDLQFPGRLDDGIKRRLFSACDLFVMPSLLEGCPLAILEALAAGAPIVASNTGGIPELIKGNRNGVLVEPRNPKQLAQAMLSLLQDEEKSREMGGNNYDDAREFFTWKKMAMLTEEVYHSALS